MGRAALIWIAGAACGAVALVAAGAPIAGLPWTVAEMLACLGYGAVFLALSMVFKNPIVPAIVFFGWEAINPVLSPLMQKLSITFYLRHLSPVDVPAEGVFALLTVVAEPVPAWAASLGVVALTAGVLLLACYRVRKLEISYTTE